LGRAGGMGSEDRRRWLIAKDADGPFLQSRHLPPAPTAHLHARWPSRPNDPRGMGSVKTPQHLVPYTEAPPALVSEQRPAAAPDPAPFVRPQSAPSAPLGCLPAPTEPKQKRSTAQRFAQLSRDTPAQRVQQLHPDDLVLSAWSNGGVRISDSESGMLNENSSYKRFLKETAAGTYMTPNGRVPVPSDQYVPPWRLTLTELYGKDMVEALRQQGRETYVQRATRFAAEEKAKRAACRDSRLDYALLS